MLNLIISILNAVRLLFLPGLVIYYLRWQQNPDTRLMLQNAMQISIELWALIIVPIVALLIIINHHIVSFNNRVQSQGTKIAIKSKGRDNAK